MAIDTALKRRSSAASRRMPWMRRFGIAPAGTIAQEQRQQGAWVYAGIPAGAPPLPDKGWLSVTGIRTATLEAAGVRTSLSSLSVSNVGVNPQ